jgi:hypothetical protein
MSLDIKLVFVAPKDAKKAGFFSKAPQPKVVQEKRILISKSKPDETRETFDSSYDDRVKTTYIYLNPEYKNKIAEFERKLRDDLGFVNLEKKYYNANGKKVLQYKLDRNEYSSSHIDFYNEDNKFYVHINMIDTVGGQYDELKNKQEQIIRMIEELFSITNNDYYIVERSKYFNSMENYVAHKTIPEEQAYKLMRGGSRRNRRATKKVRRSRSRQTSKRSR